MSSNKEGLIHSTDPCGNGKDYEKQLINLWEWRDPEEVDLILNGPIITSIYSLAVGLLATPSIFRLTPATPDTEAEVKSTGTADNEVQLATSIAPEGHSQVHTTDSDLKKLRTKRPLRMVNDCMEDPAVDHQRIKKFRYAVNESDDPTGFQNQQENEAAELTSEDETSAEQAN